MLLSSMCTAGLCYLTVVCSGSMAHRGMDRREPGVICLFDVDTTLTPHRKLIEEYMEHFLQDLRGKVKVGLVGGSDMQKISEQMQRSNTGIPVRAKFDYVFAENGLVAYKDGKLIGEQNLVKYVGEETLQKVINFCLRYIAQLDVPFKRGTFIEFRTGMLNICPIGRSCTYEERLIFAEYDRDHHVRQKFGDSLMKEFPDSGLVFAMGGMISIDIFPVGWDKTYCLPYLIKDGFHTIHFFGDKAHMGGNDYEIYEDPRTIGHKVTCPADTWRQVRQLFFNKGQ